MIQFHSRKKERKKKIDLFILCLPQKFSCDNSTSNYFAMDTSYCSPSSVIAKMPKNATSSEVTESGRDLKKNDKMRPSAASLVQRYTRNGEAFM